ncbi:MAG: DNA-processing protein DprA [Gemmatimonadota bacterium]
MKRPANASLDEVRALLVLDQLPGVGPHGIRALIDAFGSAERALVQPGRIFAQVAGSGASRARSSPEHGQRVDTGLAAVERLGMETLSWSDPAYPEALLRLADPPPVLFLRGNSALLDRAGVAVVGSRRCTTRAKDLSRRLGQSLARAGVDVVSGMALGVDAAAHFGALQARDAAGGTVAVVGRGADAPYPPSHAKLFRALLDRGLVVSEFLPGTPPLPYHFPRRNRIMAALAGTLVVVEAGARSGALITVGHALDLGRDVWAVPGPIDTGSCAGSNQLLAEGALPLVSIDRFVTDITGLVGGGRAEAGAEHADDAYGASHAVGAEGAAKPAGRPLAEPERRILRSLGQGPLHVDALAARAGLDVPVALALLVQLELDGAVEQMPGFLFRAA